jgi:feruloyl-CoA synthase
VPRGVLGPYPGRVSDWLLHWAAQAPERIFVAQRVSGGAWRQLSYQQTLEQVRALGTHLLALPLSVERPIAILSGNSIEHLLLALAAMYVGVPYAPVSPAYSLGKGEHGKLRAVLELLTPGLVAAFGIERYAHAIDIVVPRDCQVLSELWADEARPGAGADADRACAQVRAETIAKFLLTSGSTGAPKAVITTHRMMCANQAMLAQALPIMVEVPPLLVDWLPWNHVFGGSHNLNLVLAHGGTLYIDDGRPTGAGILETVRNLREHPPSVYFNVPKGFESLVPHLEQDRELRERFFSQLRALFFAGATLAQPVWDALDRLSMATLGRRTPIISGLGATETGPSVTFTDGRADHAGSIGLPAIGNQIKLTPIEDKLELRVKGPNVTPGYWRAPALTAAAFDEQGYYRLGDAARLCDPQDVSKGLMFDGRIAEDFKLSSGTWVSVGPLRASLLGALAPLVQDVVIAGLDRDYLGLLIFPAQGGERGEIAIRLRRHAAAAQGSSARIERALLLDTPPSLEAGEITDKGSINQRAVLKVRAAALETLYALQPGPQVIIVGS